ncbi:GNAT family N-acetyltransferase [Bosea sp. 685]|uniref:GNAT family N-acetyltransferase n=1 Tax=Bosea sp. 685 TaxID=3080057 RepID=UPI002892E1E0|nr:GNAT family N-acetyltransferase [Bosea sp. 685]WNJ92103.1 GNAT family N-acetyltransferase [Bosea sp. 685]
MRELTPVDDIRIRSIERGDEERLLAFWRYVWTSTYGSSLGSQVLDAMLSGLDRKGLSGMLPGNGERGYCALCGERLVGTAIAAERGQKAFLWGMYVDPGQQRLGLGTRLLSAVIADLALVSILEARALRSSPWAIAFYEGRGFRHNGDEAIELADGFSGTAAIMTFARALPPS